MPDPTPPRTTSQIAHDIAKRLKTTCSPKSTWAAARRLKLTPVLVTPGGFKFYNEEQARAIEAAMTQIARRKPADETSSKTAADAR